MNGKELLECLQNKGKAIGTLITHPSPFWPPNVAQIGFDFIFIDTEHIALDRTQVSHMCHTYNALGLAPFVRIPSPDPYQACMVADDGAVGIIAPYIETPEQVRKLVGATKLRPLKGRSLERWLSGEEEPGDELKEYITKRNSEKILTINIESVPALENLDELLSVPGVDVALIGPHDLSCSLGIPEQYDHPKFHDAVKRIIECAHKHQVAPGLHFWADIDQEIEWCRQGMQFLIHAADIIAFRETMIRDLKQIRTGIGTDDQQEESSEISI